MEAAEHVLRHLRATWNKTITGIYTGGSCRVNELWGWADTDLAQAGDTEETPGGVLLG